MVVIGTEGLEVVGIQALGIMKSFERDDVIKFLCPGDSAFLGTVHTQLVSWLVHVPRPQA